MDTRTSQLSTVTTQNITQTAIWFTAKSCHKMCQVTDFTQAQYIIKNTTLEIPMYFPKQNTQFPNS